MIGTNNVEEKILKAKQEALKKVATEMAKDVDVRVPYTTGELASSQVVNVTPSDIRISYELCEYSQYAFNGTTSSGKPKQYNKSYHSLATAEPIKVAQEECRDKWISIFKETFNRGLK